jgi:hypothetical protein
MAFAPPLASRRRLGEGKRRSGVQFDVGEFTPFRRVVADAARQREDGRPQGRPRRGETSRAPYGWHSEQKLPSDAHFKNSRAVGTRHRACYGFGLEVHLLVLAWRFTSFAQKNRRNPMGNRCNLVSSPCQLL